MQVMGIGHCDWLWLYADWDGKGTANQDACNQLCLSEEQCTFASYFNDGQKQTCSRYNGTSCVTDTSNDYIKAHTTYYKDVGTQGIFYFFATIIYIAYQKYCTATLRTLDLGERFSILNYFEEEISDI